MAGWRRLAVAALLQLAFSGVFPTENCYEKGELSQGGRYFNCSKPRLIFSDTPSILTMDFRNKNKNNVFSLSLNRTADAFHLITRKGNETINSTQIDLRDSSSKLHLKIKSSSVRAKTHGTWRKLDIPKTDEIFSLYFRRVPPNPAFCITCYGEDIWLNGRDTSQSTEQGVVETTQSTEQGVVQSTQRTEQGVVETTEQSMTQSPGATEQSEPVILWPLCFILLPILGLLLHKRKHLCGKMQLQRQALRTCCHKTNEATTESELEMPGYFHQAPREETGTVHVKGEFEAGQVVREEVETENDIYISADYVQRSEDEEYETVNDIYVSADVHHFGSEEYETVNDIYVSADVHHFGSEEYETVNDIYNS